MQIIHAFKYWGQYVNPDSSNLMLETGLQKLNLYHWSNKTFALASGPDFDSNSNTDEFWMEGITQGAKYFHFLSF